jgi:hypothetical protein
MTFATVVACIICWVIGLKMGCDDRVVFKILKELKEATKEKTV